jgi:muramoyltetrapeptide carboxypeptidase
VIRATRHSNPIFPPGLQAGDRVALVTVSAPEAARNPDRVDMGVSSLRGLGLDPILFPHALADTGSYLAASPLKLAADINQAFSDPSIAGIICTGGGTNANRILPYLDYELIAAHPKVFMGMSNVSVVLNAIYARANLVTFHGPVLVWNFGAPEGLTPLTLGSFMKTVWMAVPPGRLPREGVSGHFLRPGSASGRVVGGNLWTIQSLLGTPYEPNWKGAIFLWEDIGKEPKRLDAVLTHFRLAGIFDKIVGMVIGRLVACDASDPSIKMKEILLEVTNGYDFPILYDVLFGHTDDKLVLPIGGLATIDSSSKTLSIDEAVVTPCLQHLVSRDPT